MENEVIYLIKQFYIITFPFIYALIFHCFLSDKLENRIIKSILLGLAFLTYDIFVNILS